MSSPQQAISIAAPGFYGLNTQESSVALSSGFALEAYNCVIDRYGRIGARRGWSYVWRKLSMEYGQFFDTRVTSERE